jgi:hypothetical protein
MLHNKRRKCKGENFFILLFLLQEMMHPCYPCPSAQIQQHANRGHGLHGKYLVGFLADERGNVEIVNA